MNNHGPLRKYPSPENWHNHTELDAQAWPKRIEKNYSLIPTTCFNCESACGLMAYVDKETGKVSKFEETLIILDQEEEIVQKVLQQ